MTRIQSSTGVFSGAVESTEQPISGTFEANGCEGAAKTIDALIFLVQKLNTEMRDLERKFAGEMQRVVFDRQVAALELKREAIKKDFDAAVKMAVSEMAGGIVEGAVGLSGSDAAKSLAKIGTSTMHGLMKLDNAKLTTEAKELNVNADIQEQLAREFEKSREQAMERANEASRQMAQVTAELVNLHGRAQEALQR